MQDNHVIGTEEIFGPVMSILKWSSIDEVVERANNTMYGLAASVFTKDLNVANWTAAQLKAGTVWINCHNIIQPMTPFGGFKASGFGRDNGSYALREYTQVKCITTSYPSLGGTPKLPLVNPASNKTKATHEQQELKQGETA